MNDYLTDKDKEKLESIGFRPHDGRYGWTPRGEDNWTYTIIALAKKYYADSEPDVIAISSECGTVYHTPFNDAKDFGNKTLAPYPPKEILFSQEQFEIESHGRSPYVLKDRLGLLIDSSIGMKIQEFRDNIVNGEYDLVFRRRK